ncbi:hypothetical protein HCMG_01479 [Helicobacter canadensis MIT 98-5491]|nr:hypothetical protein HCMG_01479 [Helicobacter canadensis MIT 98-5491]
MGLVSSLLLIGAFLFGYVIISDFFFKSFSIFCEKLQIFKKFIRLT